MSPNALGEFAGLPMPAPHQPYLPTVYNLAESAHRGSLAATGPRVAWLEVAEEWRALGLVEFAHVIAQLPDLERVTLTGRTDPTRNDELAAIIGLLKLRADRVLLDTRASALTAGRSAEIVLSGLDELRVSGPEPARAGAGQAAGLPAHVRARLHDLAGLRAGEGAAELRIVLRCPARLDSMAYLPALLRLAGEIGADEVYLARVVYALNQPPAARPQAAFGAFTAHVDAILSECEALSVELGVALRAAGGRDPRNSLAAAAPPEAEPWRACRRPWAGVYVTAGGDCLPCRVAPEAMPGDASLVMGNVLRQPMAEIWNGPRYQAFREALLSPRPHPACAGCGVRWSL